jgi:molybdopterin-guanine dinucleotide biosynthesis protein A
MGTVKAGILLSSGKTMIEHVYRAMARVCSRVVLVGHGDGVVDRLDHLPRVRERQSACGPLGGLQALLSSGIDYEYLVSPCDLPQVTPEVFRMLVSCGENPPVILSRHKKLEPLIGRYSRDQLVLVDRFIDEGKLAMHDLADACRAHVIDVPAHLHYTLHNANRKEDLLQLL